VLRSILVPAGSDGASIDEIADGYRNECRPRSRKVALRVSASLRNPQPPEGWDIVSLNGGFRLVPGGSANRRACSASVPAEPWPSGP